MRSYIVMKGKVTQLKKTVLAVVSVLMMALMITMTGCSKTPTNPAKSNVDFTGYLICQNCGLKGTCDTNDIDLTTHPEKYTLKCAKMPVCVTSGYGIAAKQANGKYRFYPFDSNGSIMALDKIVYSTKKTDNLSIVVKGTLHGDMIAVQSIMEQ
jgi:hypothetical protein